MPISTTVNVLDYEGKSKPYTVRAFMPMSIRNQMQNLSADIEKGTVKADRLQEYLLMEMSLAPTKITEAILKGEDCDSFEMDQLFEEIMRIGKMWVDPDKLIGKTKDEQQKIMRECQKARMDELKKKPPSV